MHTKCPFYHISVNMTGECKRDEERKGRAEEAQGVSHDSTLQSDEESHPPPPSVTCRTGFVQPEIRNL